MATVDVPDEPFHVLAKFGVVLDSLAARDGDDDQLVPFAVSAPLSAKLLRKASLKVYPGLGHGICTINADLVNADLLAFIASG